MASCDITVRGAGIFGLSTAWVAASRGAKVQVIDPNGPASGASGGIVGALAPHVPENWNVKKAFQLESLLMAEEFWADVDAAGGGASGYARAGRVQPVAKGRPLDLARQRGETAKEFWQEHAAWAVRPTTGADWEPQSPSGYVIRDTLSALIHPRRACEALVSALSAKGVPILTEAADTGQTLWATGVAGLHDLTAQHSRSMGNGVKGQAALLDFDARGLPQVFAEGVHIIPHQDGRVAIGSTSEREYTSATDTDAQLNAVIAVARAALPVLQNARVVQRWAGVRPRARSRAPMLGAWPDKAGHFIANGGFKIGFGMAPKVANVMVDLMLEGRDVIPQGFRVEDNL